MKKIILTGALFIILTMGMIGMVGVAQAGSVALSANPTSLAGAGAVSLSWSTIDTSCNSAGVTLTPAGGNSPQTVTGIGWDNGKILMPKDSQTINLTAPGVYVFSLACSGANNTIDRASASVTLTPAVSKANITYGSTYSYDKTKSLTTWVKGDPMTVLWNKDAFGSTTVDIWICTGTNPNVNCAVAAALGIANNGAKSLTFSGTAGSYYFFVRKNGDWGNTFVGNGFSGAVNLIDSAPVVPTPAPVPTPVPTPTPTTNPTSSPSTPTPTTTTRANLTFYPTGNWTSGQTRTLSWNTGTFNSNVDIWLCTASDASKSVTVAKAASTYCPTALVLNTANSGNYATAYSASPGTYYFYLRRAGDAPNTFVGNAFSGAITVTAPAVVANQPLIQNVYLGASGTYSQLATIGIYDQIPVNFSFKNFGQNTTVVNGQSKKVNAVSLSLCDSAGSNCLAFPGLAVYALPLPLQTSGTINFNNLITVSLAKNYAGQTKIIKVCPLAIEPLSTLGNISYAVSSGVCGQSSAFKLLDPNDANSPTWNLPSGQGCMENDCVCVNGQAKRCGNPMKSGTGCPATSYCAKGPTASLSGRLLGAVGLAWVNLIGRIDVSFFK